MSTDRTHRAVQIVLATVVLVGGCSWQKKKSPAAIPSSEQQSPVDHSKPKVDQMDAAAPSLDALTRKTEAYAREFSPLVSARNQDNSAATAAPSKVQWADSSQFSLDTPAQSETTSPKNDAKLLPVANTPLSTTPPKTVPAQGNAVAANTPITLADPVLRAIPPRAPSDALADKLSRRVKDDPRDVSAQLEYQMLKFLLDQPTPDLETLGALPSEDREIVAAVIDGLSNFRNGLRADNNMLVSRKIKPLEDTADRLASQAELTIPAVALCSAVEHFGSYDPIDPPKFAAGSDHKVVFYCEIANFTSQLNDKQMWQTKMTCDMTLYTEAGMSVWSDPTAKVDDTSHTRRHDFFLNKFITLPKTLTIGRYLLKVTIVDTQSNRVAESTVPIVIAAK